MYIVEVNCFAFRFMSMYLFMNCAIMYIKKICTANI